MNKKGVRIIDLLEAELQLNFQLLTKKTDLEQFITSSDINRPGLALAGFFEHFAGDRVQVFGRGESAYLHSLDSETLDRCYHEFFSYSPVCLIFTHNLSPPDAFIRAAEEAGIAILQTPHSTHKLVEIVAEFLDFQMAVRILVHGVFIEVFGVGVLLQGKPGVGKSETALELVERGHRLIADDAIEVARLGEAHLYGYASKTIEHHMEIRGLGIINIKDLYGSGSVRNSKHIDLVIHLDEWDQAKEYDRLGIDDHKEKVLDIEVPSITIPIGPGRNIPVLIENAAKNHNLKLMGRHPAREFSRMLRDKMKEGESFG